MTIEQRVEKQEPQDRWMRMLRSAWTKGVCGVVVLYLVVFGIFQTIEGTSRGFARWKALLHGEIGYFLWHQGTPEYERKRIRPLAKRNWEWSLAKRNWEYRDRTEVERVELVAYLAQNPGLRDKIVEEILDKKRWTLGTWLDAKENIARQRLSLGSRSADNVEIAVRRYMNFIKREE